MRILQKFFTFISIVICLVSCGPLTSVAVKQHLQSTSIAPIPQIPIPVTWRTFENPALNVSLRYPENWQEQTIIPSGTRISGPDGFFEVTSLVQRASRFEQIETWCILEANDPSLSSRYGPHPDILVGNRWNPAPYSEIGNGCVILPSSPAGSQAVLHRSNSLLEAPHQILILRADVDHFSEIISSLKFPKADQLNHPGEGGQHGSSLCKETPKSSHTSTRQVGDFVIHEYAIANAGCDPWPDFDAFQARVNGLKIEQKNATQSQDIESILDVSNRKLAPFDYRLVAHPVVPPNFDLFKGDELVLAGFTYFSEVSVNAAGDDFILWVHGGQNQKDVSEVRLNSVRTLKGLDEGFNSVWIGANLIRFGLSQDRIEISSNDHLIQTYNVPPIGPSGTPLRRFWSWKDHWFVEVSNVMMQDGEIQNLKFGVEEIFGWQVIDDKPFFMMRKDQSYGIVYAGQALPIQYDDILHGDLCCDLNTYQIREISNGAQFYALKDGVWFLVSVQTAK